jgi:O-antigen/teichoic acid export membrane protein
MIIPNLGAASVALLTHNIVLVSLTYSVGAVFVGVFAVHNLRKPRVSSKLLVHEGVSHAHVRGMRKYGRGAFLGTMNQQLNARLDLVLVGLLFTATSTGIYAVAVSLGQLAMPLFVAGSLITFQRVASAPKFVSATTLGWHYWKVAAAASIVLVLIGEPLVQPALTTIYGSRYVAGFHAAQYLYIGTCVSGVTLITNEILRGLGHPKRSSAGDALGVVVMAALIVGLRPHNISTVALYSCVGYLLGLLGASATLFYSVRSQRSAESSA